MSNADKKGVWNGFLRFTASLNALGSFGIFLILLFVTSDVVGRVVFNHPLTGTPEIIKVGVVGVVFMQIPWALWTNRHIRSDLIVARLKPRAQVVAALIRNIFAAAAFICIFIANWQPMIKAWQILEYEGEGALHVPVYPIFTLIQLGSTLAAVIALYNLWQNIKHLLTAGEGG